MGQEELLIIDLKEIMWKLIQTIRTYRLAADSHSWHYSRIFIERSQNYCLFALALEKKVRVLENEPEDLFREVRTTSVPREPEISMDDFISLIQRCKQAEFELLDKYNILYYKTYVAGALRDLIVKHRLALMANISKWKQFESDLTLIAS